MDLIPVQKQEQILSVQMIQSLEVLQMAAQELLEYLENIALENPVLELEERYDVPDGTNDLRPKLEWLDPGDPQDREYYSQDLEAEMDPLLQYPVYEDHVESLYDHVLAQLAELELPQDIAACTKILAGCLDVNGRLEEELAALAWDSGQSEETMEQALTAIQSLEPAGIAARNLSECLCLQLLRRTPVNLLAVRIAQERLDALAKNHYGLLSRTLGASLEEVRQACDLIRSLDPRPGLRFARYERPVYITPDIIVTNISGQFELSIDRRFLPVLSISPYYSRMLKEGSDIQVQEYLANKLKQAKWVIQAVEQRHETLMSCAKCILTAQEDFFHYGGHLKPLTMANVAERMGVHESTVSRAVNGKHLQCARGTYPLSYFFSRRLNGGGEAAGTSPDEAKALIKRIIAREDKSRPLSDQKLCEQMVRQGCAIARRTVAKYRDELGIPGTAGRKQRP